MICFLLLKLKVALATSKKTFNRAKVINKFDSHKLSFVKIINFKKLILTTNQLLEIGNKLYSLEEFGLLVRYNYGDNNVSNIMLAEIFLSKYTQYLCNIKKADSKKSSSCC